MATATTYKQDLPPPGGYKPITCTRIPTKSFFRGWQILGGYLVMTAGAGYVYYLNYKAVHIRETEVRSANLAIYPMLLAERDRAYLKQLRKNRDEETELMKNVEGWKTGTWYGEPIFHCKDKNTLIDPMIQEYYVHSSYKDFKKRVYIPWMS